MLGRKNADRLPPEPARRSPDELDNQRRNELQKTFLLREHRHLLEKRRSTLLDGLQELLDRGKKSVDHLKTTIGKASDSSGRKVS